MASRVDDLRTPCLVMRRRVAQQNAERMLRVARELGCRVRPHVKTHKTWKGALLQLHGESERREGDGGEGIVVSTLAEAHFFAQRGMRDILYAVPITPDKLPAAAALSLTLPGHFHIIVDHEVQLDAIVAFGPPSSSTPWSVWIMVDCGYGRDGCDPSCPTSVELAKRIAAADPSVTVLGGLYTHGGHSYDASDAAAVRQVSAAERDAVTGFAAHLRALGLTVPVVSVGSTPTCSLPPTDGNGLSGVDEIHPGNYIYYDMMQATLGACQVRDIAVRVLTRVVGHYPKRGMLLIDMGWRGCTDQGRDHGFGQFLDHPELRITSLKQECGEVEAAVGQPPLDFSRYPIGSILRFLPWHACAATAMHDTVHVLDIPDGQPATVDDVWSSEAEAEEMVVDEWEICRGW